MKPRRNRRRGDRTERPAWPGAPAARAIPIPRCVAPHCHETRAIPCWRARAKQQHYDDSDGTARNGTFRRSRCWKMGKREADRRPRSPRSGHEPIVPMATGGICLPARCSRGCTRRCSRAVPFDDFARRRQAMQLETRVIMAARRTNGFASTVFIPVRLVENSLWTSRAVQLPTVEPSHEGTETRQDRHGRRRLRGQPPC